MYILQVFIQEVNQILIKINTSGKSITNNGTINISNSQIRSSDALTNDGILVSENDNITAPL